MNRIDRIVLARVGGRILLTVFVIFGLILLVEALDTWRFRYLSDAVGMNIAILTIFVAAAKWTMKTLPVTVLLGATIGMLELQARSEMTIIKSSGTSIWTAIRAPIIAVLLVSTVIALYLESEATRVNRIYNYQARNEATARTPAGELWLEQEGDGTRYVLTARSVGQIGGLGSNSPSVLLKDVTIVPFDWPDADRIEGPDARLIDGAWRMPTATFFLVGEAPRTVEDFAMPTTTTVFDLTLRLRSPDDMTIGELLTALQGTITEPALLTAVVNRLAKLMALPILLTGSLFIAFAFTAGYRRTNKYGLSVVTAVVLGFLVFVVTEMADRAGSSGALDPMLAAVGPAVVAIVIGLTVLLRKEDGRV